MTDAKSATEAALFAELDAGVTGAQVFQDAPANAQLPIVIIGDMTATPIGAPGDPDRRVAVTILTIVEAEERQPLLDLQAQVETLLDDIALAYDGWTIRPTFESADAVLGGDGVTYVGSQQFTVFALRD